MVLVPLLRAEPLQGADARLQHVSGRGLELGQGLVVNDEIVVGHEEEAEHVAALAQQLDPRLNEGGRRVEDLLLARRELVKSLR